jgi:hypothetical protein
LRNKIVVNYSVIKGNGIYNNVHIMFAKKRASITYLSLTELRRSTSLTEVRQNTWALTELRRST